MKHNRAEGTTFGRLTLLGATLLFSMHGIAADDATVGNSMRCEGVSVQVLGSGGPEIDDGRASSAYLVWYKDNASVLVDAGSGSSVQFGAAGASFETLDAILLSHLHTDHSADLPSFVKGSYFGSRTRDLPIIGPAGNDIMPSTNHYIEALFGDKGAFRYLSSYTRAEQDDYLLTPISVTDTTFSYDINPSITVSAINVHHGPIPALAWKVNVNGCTAVFSGDTNDADGTLSEFAKQADILVLHNAIGDKAGKTAKQLHMTPTQLINIASTSKAKRVVLSHIMKRSEPGLSALTDAIAVIAPGRVYAAQDLMNIPLHP